MSESSRIGCLQLYVPVKLYHPMIHRKIVKFLGLAAMLALLEKLPAAESSGIFSDLTFDRAVKQAATDKKVILIDFFTTWCGPCKLLDNTTWTDAKVATLLAEKAIALKIDAEKETTLAGKYKVNAYPTILILRADGTIIDQLVGYRSPEVFVSEFNAALSGKTALSRATEDAAANGGLDPMKRQTLGRELARSGRNEEALKEFLWCYDEGLKYRPSYVGVRSSYLLGDIARLGREYPPALAALKERRDLAEKSLSTDPKNRVAAGEYASLNHALEEDRTTLTYFDKLRGDSPIRRSLGYHIFDLLLDAKRYKDAAEVRPYHFFLGTFEEGIAHLKEMDTTKLPNGAAEMLRKYEVESAAKEVEALAGAEIQDDADTLIKKVLAFDHSAAAVATLRDHLARAGHADLLTESRLTEAQADTQEKGL